MAGADGVPESCLRSNGAGRTVARSKRQRLVLGVPQDGRRLEAERFLSSGSVRVFVARASGRQRRRLRRRSFSLIAAFVRERRGEVDAAGRRPAPPMGATQPN